MKKKTTMFVSLGLMCITFFLSCEANHETEETTLNAMLEVPEKVISNADAAQLFQNDHRTRLSVIGKKESSFEDKAIHYNLNTLIQYIQHLETIATSKTIPITGISFIFGANNEGKRTNFIMPSTRNAELDYQESFTIENGQFLTFKHIEPNLTKKDASFNDENLILSPKGYLSYNEAVTLFNEYQTQYIGPFAAKVKRDYYTKAVWYSLSEIKEYVAYLKKRNQDYNLAITGIDVFFGVYNEDERLELKSNAQTVFLTASTQQQTIINTKGTFLKNFIQNGFFAKESDNDTNESLTFNLGHLSPPPNNN
ncbi:hypothetical protein [Kordia zhangzhouensis]|uniref:hypothetical protein n=1 Tax=Kordia zhangzhouensis TaxID=1620405 RepID=UPI0006299F5E|nr:hypothetical protein [Kordia zhangzhouensis]